ncbi:MAG: VWA domain-containing protein, partial [Campylobacter sp.]|nr:VWA domain-containing protein [Campylobacter sp.]
GGSSGGNSGSWGYIGGGGGWGNSSTTYIPSTPSKPSLPYIPEYECHYEPELNSVMRVKLPSFSPRSLSLATFSAISDQDKSKLYFDMNSDGFKERMLEWMGDSEALLVNDINNNSVVDSGLEIVGNNYNYLGYSDSFSMLKEFDTNKNGIIDSRDDHNLAIWIDKNKNATTDKDELIYLKDKNSPIQSIELNPLDTLLSGYDKNHDFKIDSKDGIYNYIYYQTNLDNSANLYIYGDDSIKEYLGGYDKGLNIKTNKGLIDINEIIFYTDINSLNLTQTTNYEVKDKDLSHTINANNLNNTIVATSKDDIIYAKGGDDIVYAKDGDDTIVGGDGKDILYGENGYDTYVVDRYDTIIDSDGKGRVYLDGGLLSSGVFVGVDKNGDKIYKNSSHSYRLNEKNQTLIVDDSLRIENFKNGDLDINLLSQENGFDTVIVIDRTASMQNSINEVKKESINLINTLLSSEYGDRNSKVAVVTYTSGDIRVHTTFTSDKQTAINAINSIPSVRSGSASVAQTLNHTLDGSVGEFRTNSNSRVYIFGDDYSDSSSNLSKAINTAKQKDISIYSISIGRNLSEFQKLADETNGKNLYIQNANEVAKVLLEAMLDGSSKNDLIEADDSANVIHAKDGNDIIYAKGGNDTIYAGSGDDFIVGGSGDDEIHTGSGNDILFFEKGDGKDRVFYENGDKIIQFGKSVTKDDISFYLDGKTFKLSYSLSDEISIDIASLNASLRIELSSGEFLELKDIYQVVKNLTLYASKNGISLSNKTINSDKYLKSIITNSFKQGEVSKITTSEPTSPTTTNNQSLNLDELQTDKTVYIDDKVLLSQTDIDEILLRSGYTGIKTSGVSAIATANGGGIKLENVWFKSDNTDTIYNNQTSSYISGSGTVKGLDDSLKDNEKLKNSIDNYTNSLDTNFNSLSSSMDDILNNWALNGDFNTQKVSLPPLVLDLNNSGVTSTSLKNSDTYFDYKNDGRRYKTSWIEQGDGLLAIDINSDGVINNAYELFGNYSKLKDGSYAKDGFDALVEFDSNNDGVIDENDEKFDKLLVWQDKNLDGKSQKDEISSLKELGISSISLNITDETKEENGNQISAQTTFTKDGKELIINDVWFNLNPNQSIAISDLSDEDEKKISVVEAFRGTKLTDFQRSNPYEILKALKEYDSIKYDTISKLISKELFGKELTTCHLMYQSLNQKLARIISGNSNPNETTLAINLLAASLQKDYHFTIHKIGKNTLSHPTIQSLLEASGIKFSFGDDRNLQGFIGKNHFGSNDSDSFDFSESKSRVIVEAKAGNDLIVGSNHHDEIDGGSGNDIIFGGDDGIDILRGSSGDDLLLGGDKSTVYEYSLGDGNDIIIDDGGVDILAFSYLNIENLSIEKDGNDMKILVENPDKKGQIIGSILIKDGFKDGKIEEYYFKNRAYKFDEMFKIVSANSTYHFNSGDGIVSIEDAGGIDKLIFGDGVTFENIIVTKKENDLEVALSLPNRSYDELVDKLSIKNFFSDTGRIESFIFKNGIILNHEEILRNLTEIEDNKFIIGDEKDNILNGTDNSNTLNGKGGNDILNGGLGDDTYIFEKGSEKDTIFDTGGVDKIVFGLGISKKDIKSRIVGDDLVVGLKEDGVLFENLKDTITIKNWKNSANKIESVMYDDGGTYDIETILNSAPTLNKPVSTFILKNTNTISSNIGASDIDLDSLTYKVLSPLTNSTLDIDRDGNFTYRANKDFIGVEDIVVEVSDGELSVIKKLSFNNLGYVVNSGDDIVIDSKKAFNTSLNFNSSIKDLDFIKKSDDLIISSSNSKLTLKEYFTNRSFIKSINFKDKSLDISSPNTPVKKWWQINPSIKLSGDGLILSYQDNSTLKGSSGDDTIISLNKNANIISNSGKDFIYSSGKDSTINSKGKDSTIISKGENSKVLASKYDDYIVSGLSAYIKSFDGDDDVVMLGDKSLAYLGSGDDRVTINSADSISQGESGNDTLISNGNNNTLIGGDGSDTYIINKNSNNTIIKDKEFVNLIDGGDDTLILKDTIKDSL